MTRAPAAVLAALTVIVPRARSASRQARRNASPIRRPANASVASNARRPARPPRSSASRSSSPAASSSAAMWSARSIHVRRGASAFTRRCFPFAGFLAIRSYSSACSRIAARVAINAFTLLGDSRPAATFRRRYSSTSSTRISSSRFSAKYGSRWTSSRQRRL